MVKIQDYPIAPKRKMGGKFYTLIAVYSTKEEAQEYAEKHRGVSWISKISTRLFRILPYKKGYGVWEAYGSIKQKQNWHIRRFGELESKVLSLQDVRELLKDSFYDEHDRYQIGSIYPQTIKYAIEWMKKHPNAKKIIHYRNTRNTSGWEWVVWWGIPDKKAE